MTDTTLRRLDFISYLTHQILNACSLIDCISMSSVGKIFIIFTSLKLKKVFMIHGIEFSYILLDEKFPSCIKDPQHEDNNLVNVGYRVSQRNRYYLNFPGTTP